MEIQTITKTLIGWALILSGALPMVFGWGLVLTQGTGLLVSFFLGLIGTWALPQPQPENATPLENPFDDPRDG